VGIARAIGMRSLAEGVEDGEQARRLRDIGCDMLQGYHFCRPLPLADVIARHGDGGMRYERRA